MCTRTKLEKLLNEYVQDDEASLAIMYLVNRYHDEGYEEGMFSSNENTRLVQEEIEDEERYDKVAVKADSSGSEEQDSHSGRTVYTEDYVCLLG